MYYEFSSYFINKENDVDISRFKITFDKIIDENGNLEFTMDKNDQVPFGLTALQLYKTYTEAKYLNFSEYIFQFILKNLNDKDVMTYNKSSDNHYVDVLGMIVPFLVNYYKVTKKDKALILAKKQICFFEQHGIDNVKLLPSHSFHNKTGLLCEPRNITEFVEKLLWIMQNYSTDHIVKIRQNAIAEVENNTARKN